MTKDESIGTRDGRFICAWAVLVGCLLLFSFRLWVPGLSEFPRVPIWGSPSEMSIAVQCFATIGLFFGLVVTCLDLRRVSVSSSVIAVSFAVHFCCNQHCLQPWAWQAFIIAVLMSTLPIEEAKKWIAWLMVSIYLYSAIGKFDYQFVNSLGSDFLNVILSLLGFELEMKSPLRPWLVLLFPLGELIAGIALIFRRTRIIGVCLAIVIHLSLITILSPAGLNHRPPVLVWNGLSIVLVWWLFMQSSSLGSNTKADKPRGMSRMGVVFALVVLLGPLLRPIQMWDHWLAWGLYSPSNSRVELLVADSAKERIREDSVLEYFVDSGQPLSSEIMLSKWSLDELGVPIYPQARFQKTVASKWLKKYGLAEFAALRELGPSHPLTGERTRETVELE